MGLTALRYSHSGVHTWNNQLFAVSTNDLPELDGDSDLITHPQLSCVHDIVLCPLVVSWKRLDCKIKENYHPLACDLSMRASFTSTPSN